MKKIHNVILRWILTTKETDIGFLYIIFGTIFGVIGLFHLIKFRLCCLDNTYAHNLYAEIVTSFFIANVFIFFSLMPLLVSGLGNFLVPKLCEGCDPVFESRVAFPLLNAIGVWVLFFSFCFLQCLFFILQHSSLDNVDYMYIFDFKISKGAMVFLMYKCIQGAFFSTLACLFNFSVTILAYWGISAMLFKTSWYLGSMILTFLLALVSAPFLFSEIDLFLVVAFKDIHKYFWFGSPALIDSSLFKHFLYWLGTPFVYILMVPTFGVLILIIERSFVLEYQSKKKGLVRTENKLCLYILTAFSVFFCSIFDIILYLIIFFVDDIILVRSNDVFVFLGLFCILFFFWTVLFIWWCFDLLLGKLVFFDIPTHFFLGALYIFLIVCVFKVVVFFTIVDDSCFVKAHLAVAHFNEFFLLGTFSAVFAMMYSYMRQFFGEKGWEYNELLARTQFWLFFIGVHFMLLSSFLLSRGGLWVLGYWVVPIVLEQKMWYFHFIFIVGVAFILTAILLFIFIVYRACSFSGQAGFLQGLDKSRPSLHALASWSRVIYIRVVFWFDLLEDKKFIKIVRKEINAFFWQVFHNPLLLLFVFFYVCIFFVFLFLFVCMLLLIIQFFKNS